jgi:hypothetical protein
MSIIEDMSDVLQSGKSALDQQFMRQMDENEAFRKRMAEGGVFPKKKEFSIPLIERIGTLNFSD